MGLACAPLSAIVTGAVAGNRQDRASSVYNTLGEPGGVFGSAPDGRLDRTAVADPQPRQIRTIQVR